MTEFNSDSGMVLQGLQPLQIDSLNDRVKTLEGLIVPMGNKVVAMDTKQDAFEKSQANWIATILGVGGLLLGAIAALWAVATFILGDMREVKTDISDIAVRQELMVDEIRDSNEDIVAALSELKDEPTQSPNRK